MNLNERWHVLSHVCEVGLKLLAHLVLHLARLLFDFVLLGEGFSEIFFSTLKRRRDLIVELSVVLFHLGYFALILSILFVELL